MVMNMSKWSDLYEEEISKTTIEAYVNEKLRTKKEIIKLIDKYVKNGSVLELGSGTGVLACKISSFFCTKEAAIKSTSCSMPKRMSSLSFSLI